MASPCIITVAITGSVPRKKDTPAVPVAVTEPIESTHEAFEAGATVAHIHVRDDQENSSSDPDRFAAVVCGRCLRSDRRTSTFAKESARG